MKCYTCGGEASLEVWKEGDKGLCYFECDCGLITAITMSKDEIKLVKKAKERYTIKKERVLTENVLGVHKLKSCFCGDRKPLIERNDMPSGEKTQYVICLNCYRTTEEGNDDGTYKTEEQTAELWNREFKEEE
jgi:hypothetical protein